MNLVNTYEKIFETVWHNYTCIIKERAKAANPYQTKPSQEF